MKRVMTLALVLTFSAVLVGCQDEKKTAGDTDIKLGLAPGEEAPAKTFTGPTAAPPTTPSSAEVIRSKGPAVQPIGGGTVTQPPAEDPAAEATGLRGPYTVQKGDTLMSLARKHYGEAAKWKDIWNANRDKIPDPNVLKAGLQITLP